MAALIKEQNKHDIESESCDTSAAMEDLKKLTDKQLRTKLSAEGQITKGKKEQLIERLLDPEQTARPSKRQTTLTPV